MAQKKIGMAILEKDVREIVKISEEILKYLEENDHSDYFGGVDADEVREATYGRSMVLCCVENREILGFILLLANTEKDGTLDSFTINGYGVKPSRMKEGIGSFLVTQAKLVTLRRGAKKLIGMIHPDNIASRKTLQSIAKNYTEGEEFTYTTRYGREVRRKEFVVEL